jgi:hypothetical protein
MEVLACWSAAGLKNKIRVGARKSKRALPLPQSYLPLPINM